MDNPTEKPPEAKPPWRRELISLLRAFAVGGAFGVAAIPVVFVFAGSGHGTVFPSVFFYSPLWLLGRAFTLPTGLFVFFNPLTLYGGYAAILWLARKKGKGRLAYALIVSGHYIIFALHSDPFAEFFEDNMYLLYFGCDSTSLGWDLISLGWDSFLELSSHRLDRIQVSVMMTWWFVWLAAVHIVGYRFACGIRRRWFQFSIRSLLLLMLLCALGCAWPDIAGMLRPPKDRMEKKMSEEYSASRCVVTHHFPRCSVTSQYVQAGGLMLSYLVRRDAPYLLSLDRCEGGII